MKLTIEARHFDADQKLKDLISGKFQKFETFYDRIVSGRVVLDLESNQKVKDKVVELELMVPGQRLFCKNVDKSFEVAVDGVVDIMSRQLRKYKTKQAEH